MQCPNILTLPSTSLQIVFLIAASVFDLDIWSNLTTAYTLAIAVSFIFKSESLQYAISPRLS